METLLLQEVGSVAAAAARHATLLVVAEWTQRAENRTENALRGMGEVLGVKLLAFIENQATASQQNQGRELLALQEGVADRIALQERAISMIDAGLEVVHQRAETQAHEFGRLQVAVQGDWHQAEQWINAEMDQRLEAVGKRLKETKVRFIAANQRLENEAKLGGKIDGQRFLKT